MHAPCAQRIRASATLPIDNPVGHPDNPMDDEAIGEKFSSLAVPVLGAKRSSQVLQRLWGTPTERDLMALLQTLAIPR